MHTQHYESLLDAQQLFQEESFLFFSFEELYSFQKSRRDSITIKKSFLTTRQSKETIRSVLKQCLQLFL